LFTFYLSSLFYGLCIVVCFNLLYISSIIDFIPVVLGCGLCVVVVQFSSPNISLVILGVESNCNVTWHH